MTFPTPIPSRGQSQDVFDSAMGAFVTYLPTFEAEVTAMAAAMNLNDTTDASTSSVLIGLGAKTFTVTAGKSFQPGMYLVVADVAAPSTNSMAVQVTSYSGVTLVVDSKAVRGSGTIASWVISLSAAPADIAQDINAATAKATPIDADKFGYWDSVSGLLRSMTWANVKTVLSAACSAGWNAATVTVSDAAADTTTWPMLARDQTGAQAPTTDAGLTYDASTNVLGASISGSAASAITATTATDVTGTAVVTGAVTSSSPTAGIGYATGAGGSVTQLTSKVTSVTLNKNSGTIITASDALAGGATASFLFYNSNLAGSDLYIMIADGGALANYYDVSHMAGSGVCWVKLKNLTAGSLSEAVTIRFILIKGVVA